MYLGLNVLHNATAALVSGERVIFAQSEERFNRIKNSSGLPRLTLNYIYDTIARPNEIEAVVVYMEQMVFLYETLARSNFQSTEFNYQLTPQSLEAAIGKAKEFASREKFVEWAKGEELSWVSKEADENLRETARRYFSDNLGVQASKIIFANHHLTHAYSVIPNLREKLSLNDYGLIFTLDGQGDLICGSVGLYSKKQGYTILSKIPRVQSIGRIYHLTTGYLGMKMAEDEHKVMGLAAYAKPQSYLDILKDLREMIWINEVGDWESAFCCREDCLAMLHSAFFLKRFDAIAGALQQLLEELVVTWISYWVRETRVSTIACAGGVFMNVKANQRIAELDCVKRVFFMPSAGDESTAIGAAIYGAETTGNPMQVAAIKSAYLGVEFTDKEIQDAIYECKADSRYIINEYKDDINSQIARLLANGKVVARFFGRMEFGARALGNRSILAHPSDLSVVSTINQAIKSRDFWMPFAPSILEEDFQRYVSDNSKQVPEFMMSTYDSTELGKVDLRATVHQTDLTLRPQMVSISTNEDFHSLISAFKSITGIGALLNTSFNLHGEPVVCTPADAISTFERSGLEFLQIGTLLLAKPH